MLIVNKSHIRFCRWEKMVGSTEHEAKWWPLIPIVGGKRIPYLQVGGVGFDVKSCQTHQSKRTAQQFTRQIQITAHSYSSKLKLSNQTSSSSNQVEFRRHLHY